MILSRFFKPKWQHSNPQVRKQYMQALPASDPVLAEVARRDQEPDVRCAAIARLTEFDLLQQIAEQDADPSVRNYSESRIQELLVGKAADSPSPQVRLRALQSLPPRYAELMVLQAREPEMRRAALQWVQEESLLAEIVINDPSAEVRFAALERISEATTLERIAKLSRNRDKRISRQVKERLETSRAERRQAERIEHLCAEMESLTWDGENGLNAAKFIRLEREWQTLDAAATAHSHERYGQARARFIEIRQEEVAKRTARFEVCAALEQFLETLQTEIELSDNLKARIDQVLAEARGRWEQTGVGDDSEGRRQQQRFIPLIEAIKERERGLQRNHERAQRLREVLGQADALLQQPSQVLETDLTALKQRWSSLERPEFRHLALELQGEFEAALARLRGRLQRQEETRDQELTEIQELIGNLERALEEGELQQAIAYQSKARERLKHNISLSRKQMAALEERLQTWVPKLEELRGWRRWGTYQAQEQLCEEAESLIGLQSDPEELAHQIKDLRAAWKALGAGEDGTVAKALWKRFDNACEKAYKPCQTYFAAQAKERQNNLMKKQTLCERLEQFEADTDWEQVDWEAADRLKREVQSQWRKIGVVPWAQKKALDRRFEEALQSLEARLKPERERELWRRKAVIQRVQALVEEGDIRAAIEAAKQAQAEWHPSVQASRREEQQLWQKLRAVCDAVFERRQAEQQAADHQRQANLARKTALCEEIEALVGINYEALSQAQQKVREARQEWASIGPVPKTMYKNLEQRFEAACKQFAAHGQELQVSRLQEELQNLRERAWLCSRIEALLDGSDADLAQAAVEQTRQDWQALPYFQSPWAESIQRRFDSACQALLEGKEACQAQLKAVQANLEKKQTLCLHMEILAGVESPEEFAQSRMEYQVSRLSQSLNERSRGESTEEAHLIEAEWYLTGLLPSAQSERLEARFQRALTALKS